MGAVVETHEMQNGHVMSSPDRSVDNRGNNARARAECWRIVRAARLCPTASKYCRTGCSRTTSE